METIKTITKIVKKILGIKTATAEDLNNVLVRGSTCMTDKQRAVWNNMPKEEKSKYIKKHWGE